MRPAVPTLAAAALLLAACGPPTKHEILERAEEAETKADLQAALGDPDERDKVGPIERWSYRAKDGEVTFVITGDTVRLQATD